MMQSEDKLCVVVLFGGMSSEHEVSRVSAGTFVDQLDRQRYELLTIGITKLFEITMADVTSAYQIISKVVSTAVAFLWNFFARKYLIYSKKDEA